MTRQIVLASSSPYRRELLSRFNIPFDVQAPDMEETPLKDEN
ncbi:Maf family protein, partial [Acidihalobacter prosperus]